MKTLYGIHWFRRDLRVAGNLALHKNWQNNDGRVVGVFCFDAKFLSRPDFSVNRFQFFMNTLEALRNELRDIGSDLLFMDVGPQQAFPTLLKQLKEKPSLISWGKDYEPFARNRDKEMMEYFAREGIETLQHRDHLLIEPHELVKKGTENGFYQVYSPFARRWCEIFEEPEIQSRIARQKASLKYLEKLKSGKSNKGFSLQWKDVLKNVSDYESNFEDYKDRNSKKVSVKIPEGGSLVAYERAKTFISKIDQYKVNRDIPSINGTSKLSMFLKNGSITISQIIALMDLKSYQKKKTSRDTYFSELIWREFYYHILFHVPEAERAPFLPQYKNLKWENDRKKFKIWKEGKTGFPIVDAGMRELKQTGWMHNRVRMIVASFLVKDLHINWQWGEKYFMEELLDGDLASNNGGWQWAASTGCDPQPYFRIFNPWLQSKKFDPEGVYIRQFIPEIKGLTNEEIHQPILNHPDYPEPMVEHSEARDKALKMYKTSRDQG